MSCMTALAIHNLRGIIPSVADELSHPVRKIWTGSVALADSVRIHLVFSLASPLLVGSGTNSELVRNGP